MKSKRRGPFHLLEEGAAFAELEGSARFDDERKEEAMKKSEIQETTNADSKRRKPRVKSNVRAGGFSTSPGRGVQVNHNARRLVVKSNVRAGGVLTSPGRYINHNARAIRRA